MESEDAAGFLVSDLLTIGDTPTILLGVKREDGPANRLYTFHLAGRDLVKGPEWGGSAFEYERTAAGSLKVTVHDANPSPTGFTNLPVVVLCDGRSVREDFQAGNALLTRLVGEAEVEVGRWPLHRNGPGSAVDAGMAMRSASRLADDCALVLNAETVLRDPARALAICAISRKKIAESSMPAIAGYINQELHALDVRVEKARKTGVYRGRQRAASMSPFRRVPGIRFSVMKLQDSVKTSDDGKCQHWICENGWRFDSK